MRVFALLVSMALASGLQIPAPVSMASQPTVSTRASSSTLIMTESRKGLIRDGAPACV